MDATSRQERAPLDCRGNDRTSERIGEAAGPASSPLSLVVPIHGELAATQRFLESFERQTRPCPLLFVDDCSPDESVEWLRSRGWAVEVPPERLWFNGIVNRALQVCRTPLLGILNNDLILGRHFTDLTIAAFERTTYDVLVARTVEAEDPAGLDRGGRFRIAPLWRREGWCMLFRVASIRRLPPIPDDLRLWYGDTWIFHHAWSSGMRVGIMLHNRIAHEGGRTIRAVQGQGTHPVIVSDETAFRERYSWVQRRRSLGLLKLVPKPLRKILLPYY